MRRLLFAAGLLLASAPAVAFEHIRGGYVCARGWPAGQGPYSACQDLKAREARGRVVLAGWYLSAAALLVGSPKACIADPDSQFLFHGSGADLIARFGVPRCGASR